MDRGFFSTGQILNCLFAFFFTINYASGQSVSFNSSALAGDNLVNPTSLQFGPDGRLYVAQQNGKIFAYTVTRNGINDYDIIATETINLIQQIPNYNDDGTVNANVHTRQVTGLLVTGTAANPVLYVTSSDPRIGGGFGGTNNDKNLDTNSGVISKLTWNGSAWEKIDLVRGLPRSEENHSINGITLDETTNTLYMAQGGNTNMGAPSNNFIFLPEYAYSTAILSIDLDAIGNTTYDLPTLDDEDRTNVGPAGFEDANDPFGGNNGKNQAMLELNGPVQIYSPGWRNNYDVVFTESGNLYSFDNGPNAGWGGPPVSCSNDTSEPGQTYCDALHHVVANYYAGHPNPTRANRSNTFNASNPQSPVPVGMENPAECSYIIPGNEANALTTICSSTNGLCEYKASNFNNVMKGNLLAAAFNGKIYRFQLNGTGDAIVSGGQTVLASNFGTTPLDVTAQGDEDIFPGTIWCVNYGSNNITVFEPVDFSTCGTDSTNYVLDDDGDGYSNGDETDNGTNMCSAASIPVDHDGDFISDLNDPDDDNDSIPDNTDIYALDADNGTTTSIPVLYSFDNSDNGGISGWGFTGVMTNGIDDYSDLFDLDQMTVGGAALKFTIDNVSAGDAFENNNNQEYAYQFGVNTTTFPGDYVAYTRVMGPFAGFTPTDYQSMGMFIGTGDQDNYLKIVTAANGGATGIQILYEEAGIVNSTMYNVSVLGAGHVNLYLTVDVSANSVQPAYSIDGGAKTDVGPAIAVPSTWLEDVLAVGFISTSNSASSFPATWDYIGLAPVESNGQWVAVNTTNTCTNRHECSFVQAGENFYLLGGRGNRPVDAFDYSDSTWTSWSNPPIELHHYQAIELNGLIYLVGAFTGTFPNETPVANIYIYDPMTDTWHVGAEIPSARRRGSAGCVVYNDKIYLISGLTNGHVSGWVPWLDVFDPATNTWTILPDAPRSRDHFHAALYEDKIYAIAGRNSGGSGTFAPTIEKVDVYDISNGAWTTLPSPEGDLPTPRAGASVAVLGDEILVIGGESMSQSSAHNHTEALDVNSNTWRTMDDLITGRHGSQAIVSNYGVYIAAGSGNRGGSPELNTMEAFYLYGATSPTGTPIVQSTLTSSTASIDFGTSSHNYVVSDSITLSNTSGNQGIIISDIEISGSSDFAYSFPYSLPVVLAPGEEITFMVSFDPTSNIMESASLEIQHNGLNGTSTIIGLSGTGSGLSSLIRINAGGPELITTSNDTFMADAYYSNWDGSVSSTTHTIANTSNEDLYKTERYGDPFGYAIPITNGSYSVRLHFAEIWSGAQNTGVRLFDVAIEGTKVLDDYDIYTNTGLYTAIIETFDNVVVSDEVLNIDFDASANNAKVSAIEILAPGSQPEDEAILTVSPLSVNFSSQIENTTSAPMSITLTNTGDTALDVTGVTITGTDPGDFIHDFSSPFTLNASASTTMNITFTPSSEGSKTASLNIQHTGDNGTINLSLAGTGIGSGPIPCGNFIEQNGLLVIEAESGDLPVEWGIHTDIAGYSGDSYMTWDDANHFNQTGFGLVTYNFEITTTGRYRFRVRSHQPGPNNTEANDVWVQFPTVGAVKVKNGIDQGQLNGWFKIYQNTADAWTFNTFTVDGQLNFVYVDFVAPGTYSVQLSGRSTDFSVDRLVLYHSSVSEWAATGALPAESQRGGCDSTASVWYIDNDNDLFGSIQDSTISIGQPTGYVSNNLDCNDANANINPAAVEIFDGIDNNCDGNIDEGLSALNKININCGGGQYITSTSDTFVADVFYSTPSSTTSNQSITNIANTTEDVLYKSERYGTHGYNIPVDNGLYNVTLHFAEIWSGGQSAGARVFDVAIEGATVLNDLDIFDTVGYQAAVNFTFLTTVNDGSLDINLTSVINNAKISAISVEPILNSPPVFTVSGDVTVNEDFGTIQTVTVLPEPVPAHETDQVVNYSLSPASVAFANISFNNATGEVTINAMANKYGSQEFTITADDGQLIDNLHAETFTLTVNSVNDAPTLNSISNPAAINEDAGQQTISLSGITAGPSESQPLTISTFSNNAALIPDPVVNYTSPNATGSLTYTPVANQYGSAVIFVTVDDGDTLNNTITRIFVINVNSVNDAPAFAVSGDITVDEDFTTTEQVVVTPSVVPANETGQEVVYSLSPTPTVANVSIDSTTGLVTITAVPNAFGVQTFTITANDGQTINNTYSETFTVTVNGINEPPTLDAVTNPAPINEDAGTQTVNLSGITDGGNESQNITITAVSNNQTLIPDPVVNYTSPNTFGSLSYTPQPDEYGSATITITVDDGSAINNLYVRTFEIVVLPVNDMPTLNVMADTLIINEDAGLQSVGLTGITAGPNESQTLTVTAVTDNPALIPAPIVTYASPNSNGSLNYTPQNNLSGSATITVKVNDGQAINNEFSREFTVIVNPVNDAPVFGVSGDVTVDEDFTNTEVISVIAGNIPSDEVNQTVTYSLSPSSVSFANVSINSSTGSVTITSVPDSFGTQIFSVIANDGQAENNIATAQFTLTVNPVNELPTINAINPITIDEDAGLQLINLNGISDGGNEGQILAVTATSSNPSLIPNPTVNYTSPNATGTLNLAPLAHQFGSSVITVTVNDGQAENNIVTRVFIVTVEPVNDAPTLDAIANPVAINEDAGLQIINLTGISNGPNESQSLNIYAVSDNQSLIPNPTINYTNPNATGSLSYAPVANAYGTATIIVTVDDGESINNTITRFFTVTVNSVNDAPVFTLSGDVTVDEDFLTLETVTVTPGFVPANEQLQTVTYFISPASPSLANVSINPVTGLVSISSKPDQYGTQVFTVFGNDSQSENNIASQTFTLTVTPENDLPTLDAIANPVAIDEDAGIQFINLSGISAGTNENELVTITAISSNLSLIQNPTVVYNNPDGTGTLNYAPVANQYGTATIFVTVDDGQGNNSSVTRSFTVEVLPVNDPPSCNAITPITINEDAGLQNVSINGLTPGPNENQTLTISAISNNPLLIANPVVNYTSPNTSGNIQFSPIANKSGSSVIIVTINDGQAANNILTKVFTVTVNPVNDPPAFSVSGDIVAEENFAATQFVTVTPDPVPADESGQTVTYSLSPNAVSFADVSINSNTGKVSITAVQDSFGAQLFTITANDGQNQNNIATETFELVVGEGNNAPTFTTSGDVTVNEDFATMESVTITPDPVSERDSGQVVTYSLSPASITFANVSINNNTGEVIITSIPNLSGSQQFTITANDGQTFNNTASQTFTLTVNPVNDEPVFTTSGNITVDEDFNTTETVSVYAGQIPADEMGQSVTYALSPSAIAFANVSIDNGTGEVTITSLNNKNGSQQFTITANDGQSENNLYTRTFTLTVNPVNDAPVFMLSGDLTLDEDFPGTEMVSILPGTIPVDELNQAVSYNLSPSSINFADVSLNSATGEVSFTSLSDASGSQLFTITANDGQSENNLAIQTFLFTVNPVNDAPIFSTTGDITVDEDFSGTEELVVVPGPYPSDEIGQSVTYALSPNFVSFANVSINAQTGKVSVTAVSNANGSQLFKITANDGGSINNIYEEEFTLTVNPVNDAPTLDVIANPAPINEDAGMQIVNLSGITAGGGEQQTLMVTAVSDNPGLIPNPLVNYNSANTNGELSYTPVGNMTGTATITVTVDDGGSINNSFQRSFVIEVLPINDQPIFTLSGDVTVDEDFVTTEIVTVTPGTVPVDEVLQKVTYSIIPATVSFADVSINSATGEVSITAIADAIGSQTFTVIADDGESLNNIHAESFVLTVNPVNDAPAFTLSGNVTVNKNFLTTETVTVTPNTVPTDENGQVVTYTLTPANVSFANITFDSTSGLVTITSVNDSIGFQEFTVSADDGQSVYNNYSETFTLTVVNINYPPTLSAIIDPPAIMEDAGPQIVNLKGITAGQGENQPLTLTVTSDNPGLIPNPAVNYTSPSAGGSITYTPASDMFGTAVITVTVNDGQPLNNTTSQSFTVQVNPVNDIPTLDPVAGPVTVNEDAGVQTINLTGISGGTNETDVVTITAVSDNPSLIPDPVVTYSHPNSTAELFFTPMADQNGTATITVTVDDGQTTDNTITRVFTIAVTPVQDIPTVADIVKPGLEDKDVGFSAMDFISGFEDVDGDGMTMIRIISLPAKGILLLNGVAVNINDELATASLDSLIYSPNQNSNGQDTLLWIANDGQDYASTSAKVLINITPVNDMPTTFDLLTPADGITVTAIDGINFSWENSVDVDGDQLAYHLHVTGYGLDTTILNVQGTSLLFDGSLSLVEDSVYEWWVIVNDGQAQVASSSIFSFTAPKSTGIGSAVELSIPVKSYPNPFEQFTTIEYSLPGEAKVLVRIYSFLGQEVATLVDEQQAGKQAVVWNGKDNYSAPVSAGVYFYEIIVRGMAGKDVSKVGRLIKK